MPRPARTAAAVALLALGLAGCSSESSTEADGASSSPAGCPITFSDTWVKAADSGMTAAFGIAANSGAEDVTVVSADSDAAGRMEIHEVVDEDGSPVMREKEGGLVVPAGAEVTLQPGGDHLMLMAIPAPIEAGDTVDITVTCDDGSTAAYRGIAKPFEGADEEYQPSMEMDSSASPMESSASPQEQ